MGDETKKSAPEGLELVGGALVPSERAVEERRALQQKEEFKKRYGTPEGVAKLEGKAEAAKTALDEWGLSNPSAKEYLDAMAIWKRGWDPILAEDIEQANRAELKMRELEKSFGIQSSDIELIHYPVEELRGKGYSDKQIGIIHALDEGRRLQRILEASQTDINHIKNLLGRK